MLVDFILTCVALCAIVITSLAHYDPFMDQVYFSIAWPGSSPSLPDSEALHDDHSIDITTEKNEKYRCLLPHIVTDSQSENSGRYSGPSEKELLAPLFQQTSCSYRIEMYWTYELCHGKFLRQFHEDKEGREEGSSVQEYNLGNYDRSKLSKNDDEETREGETSQAKARTQKVSGLEIPFYAMEMSGGTACDLTGAPRSTSVHYVCQPDGRGEIYEFKETSTCEYEMVVLTSLLCAHPAYGPSKDPVNQIQCQPLDDAPRQPLSLQTLERDLVPPPGESRPSKQRRPQPTPDTSNRYERPPPESTRGHSPQDRTHLDNFLRGEYCLEGGSGWWRHEFCYGRHVIQFHQEKDVRTEILLGSWREEVHRDWIHQHDNKRARPAAERRHIWQFYSGGDVCDLTGSPRSVEVKLKCKEGAPQTSAITLFLVEPSPCHYNLVVESALLCEIIQRADDDSVIH